MPVRKSPIMDAFCTIQLLNNPKAVSSAFFGLKKLLKQGLHAATYRFLCMILILMNPNLAQLGKLISVLKDFDRV